MRWTAFGLGVFVSGAMSLGAWTACTRFSPSEGDGGTDARVVADASDDAGDAAAPCAAFAPCDTFERDDVVPGPIGWTQAGGGLVLGIDARDAVSPTRSLFIELNGQNGSTAYLDRTVAGDATRIRIAFAMRLGAGGPSCQLVSLRLDGGARFIFLEGNAGGLAVVEQDFDVSPTYYSSTPVEGALGSDWARYVFTASLYAREATLERDGSRVARRVLERPYVKSESVRVGITHCDSGQAATLRFDDVGLSVEGPL